MASVSWISPPAPVFILLSERRTFGDRMYRPITARFDGASPTGGEIQLTDAIAQAIGGDEGVYGYRFRGQRFDCGSKSGFLQATVSFGLAREELRNDLLGYIRDVVQMDQAAE
ncbi:MAG: hypothetical protein AAFO97_03485, partial [Pseudomonadota bacterium]